MRQFSTNGAISLRAISGSHCVLLGMNARRSAARRLLGFAIQRTDHTEDETYFLRGGLTFEETSRGEEQPSVYEHPIQDFKWGDYSAKPEHEYTYRVFPVYGAPKKLEYGRAVSVTVQTEPERDREHTLYFNRGVAASQAFVRKFPHITKKDLDGEGENDNSEAMAWLSRGLLEAMTSFIASARGSDWALRVCIFEFTFPPILEALRRAHLRSADVQILNDQKSRALREENQPAIRAARIGGLVTARSAPGQGLGHNKFMVLLHRGKPISVWTGSTNMTAGGILGQANVGHTVHDPAVAQAYLEYWNEARKNQSIARSFKPYVDQRSPVWSGRKPPKGTTLVFSPRTTTRALSEYVALMERAKRAVFVTFAFGITDPFVPALARSTPALRYLLMDNKGQGGRYGNRGNYTKAARNPRNRIALGDFIHEGELAGWHEEQLTGLNEHVRYVHNKYMLIDPLSSDPIVITGSANFSPASTDKNDENMLVIRGNTRVADIYLCEFMRLFSHFYFRSKLAEARSGARGRPKRLYLASDDSWSRKYYERGSAREKERNYFGVRP